MNVTRLAAAVCALATGNELLAAPPQADDAPVRAFLAAHCAGCHGGGKPKGDFRTADLPSGFATRADRERWRRALGHLEAGTMPPDSKPRPPEKDARAATDWIAARLTAAEAAQGRTVMRRLNRVEYENTVRDLLGVEIELRELLPPDASADGFDTSGEAHHVSSFLVERYLEAADKALDVAIANNPQPPVVKKRLSCGDERHVKTTTERVFRRLDGGALVCFSSSAWQAVTLSQFYPPDRGRYRFRISASAVQSGGKPVAFRVDAGPMLMGTTSHLVGYFDAPADEPAVFEFVVAQEARSTIRLLPYGLASAQEVNRIGADAYTGPGLKIDWIEVEGPLHDAWPPASHRRIFGDLGQKPAPAFNNRSRVEVASAAPEADAAAVLRRFARRAFRRPVTDDELAPYLALVKSRLGEKASFEQAVRVALKGMMVSPEFLFLREKPGELDDAALASRLSYFLWSSMPDEELLGLAEERKLSRPGVLRAQTERLLNSPKAAAFTTNFTGQWLGLRDIDFTLPDARLYPEFDQFLKASMLDETHRFFEAVLRDDLGVSNFVASDFTYLNARLAKHYGIAGVEGSRVRRVALPPGSHRGGVLTMASVLKVTANGTNTSPVVRGAWVMDRILGKPPAPPPAGVPAVEPDVRGATTIRAQLAKHREAASCAACHAKIDPPGFALESFDVIGGWRENYRSLGRGEAVTVDGRRMPYHKGPKVDPADEFLGEKFADVDGLKRLLLADKDQLARALAGKLLTYATGSPPRAGDRAAVEAVVAAAREKGHGFRTLVHAVVASDVFRRK